MKLFFSSNTGLALMTIALVLAGACNPGRVAPRHNGGDGGTDEYHPDADGDGIWDDWEDQRDAVDTDGDGTPDYMDDDSDGDGLPDSVEGQTNPTTGEPVDSDHDGTYDFRDSDSDGNGIPDSEEPDTDLDGDGKLAFADLDDDGDLINDRDEIGSDPSTPPDTDGDGSPDYQDIDSDNDTIADLHESVADTDMDGTPDRFDADSDEDGLPDNAEAGDTDPMTPPIDTDADGIPNFRDTDSDNDGLGDSDEGTYGTNPAAADTDGDGVSDLVEISACPPGDSSCTADATNPDSSPRTRGDFVFFEPYMMPPMPIRDTLDFATDLRVADVYFLMDTTGSMGGSVSSLKTNLATFIPRLRAVIPDVWIGAGSFRDYPTSSYGGAGDYAYSNLQNVTGVEAEATAGVNAYSLGYGGDNPESDIPALWAVATGMGLPGTSATPPPAACPAGHWGYPCFRDGAVPIIVLITDIYMHNGPSGAYPYSDGAIGGHAPTYDEAIAALTTNRIRVIGIGQGSGGISDMNRIAMDTGAVDGTGAALTSVWSGGAISDTVLNQIQILANTTSFDISVEYQDDASDSVDSWAAFVDYIEANEAGDSARGCAPRAAVDTDGDGHPDMFPNVTAGERVCFDIIVKQNDTVMPTENPQLFRATLRVLGDGFTELDSRDIYFLVPGTVAGPGGLG